MENHTIAADEITNSNYKTNEELPKITGKYSELAERIREDVLHVLYHATPREANAEGNKMDTYKFVVAQTQANWWINMFMDGMLANIKEQVKEFTINEYNKKHN